MLLRKEYIKQIRLEKGWTQAELAELCALSVRTIQRTEKNGVASIETSRAMAAVFEVDVHELYASGGVIEDINELPAKLPMAMVGIIMFLFGLVIGRFI